jgi:HD-like signal output (HDOD) protein
MLDSNALCESLTAKLAGHNLPVIRHTSARVIALLSSRTSDVNTIANAILQDQAFTARILNVANSAYYRRRADKITTVSRAVSHVGYGTARDIAIASEYADFAHKRFPGAVNLRRVMARAFVAAHQATALGQAIGLPEAEALFTSALLESLGEFALASYMPKITQLIEETGQTQGLPYDEAHLQVTGLTPHAITAIIAAKYQLPDDLILPPPNWETQTQWTPKERRNAVVHIANACAINLFANESPLVLSHFTKFMTRATTALGLPSGKVASLLTEAFQKSLDFGATVNLERKCFALDKSTPNDTGRHGLIETCAQLVDTPGGGTPPGHRPSDPSVPTQEKQSLAGDRGPHESKGNDPCLN